MAEHIWIAPVSSGDIDLGTNWSSGTAASAWGVTDTVVFNDSSVVDANAGLNQAGINVASITVEEGYKSEGGSRIGASGNRLVIEATKVIINNDGPHFLTGDAAGFDDIIVNSPNQVDALDLNGLFTGLYIKSGHVLANPSNNPTEIIANGPLSSLELNGGSGATVSRLINDHGKIVLNRLLGDSGIFESNGITEMFQPDSIVGTPTQILIGGGTFVLFMPQGLGFAGSLMEVKVMRGLLDLSQAKGPLPQFPLVIGQDAEVLPDRFDTVLTASTTIDLRKKFP